MSHANNEPFLIESKEFNDFIKKAQKRDSTVFFIGLLILILTSAIGGIYLYRSFTTINEELIGYRQALANGQKEIKTLREMIKSQKDDLQSLHDIVQSINKGEIHNLIIFAAEHRKEIDKIKTDVQCIKKHNSAEPCH